jgi:hypothetical protein
MTAMKALDRHVGCRMHVILTHKNKVLEEPDVWLLPHILSLGRKLPCRFEFGRPHHHRSLYGDPYIMCVIAPTLLDAARGASRANVGITGRERWDYCRRWRISSGTF